MGIEGYASRGWIEGRDIRRRREAKEEEEGEEGIEERGLGQREDPRARGMRGCARAMRGFPAIFLAPARAESVLARRKKADTL
jgi:hypothetical protein